MARERTGTLIWRKKGWCALFLATVMIACGGTTAGKKCDIQCPNGVDTNDSSGYTCLRSLLPRAVKDRRLHAGHHRCSLQLSPLNESVQPSAGRPAYSTIACFGDSAIVRRRQHLRRIGPCPVRSLVLAGIGPCASLAASPPRSLPPR